MALNQLKYDQLETGSIYPITASYAISSSAGSGGTTLITGSTYPITSSWAANSVSGAYSVSSSISTNSLTASFANSSSYAATSVSGAYSSTSSIALNALTASYLDPISQSLIPSTGSTYSLGSPTNKWKDLYVSTGSIYIGDTVLSTSGSTLYANTSPVVTLNTASNQIEIIGITASLSASYAINAGLLDNTSSTVFATTGSNNFSGSQTVQGNITVIGSLIAQQYVISSSVSYFTSSNFDGSTKFGDTESDTHQFTGSLRSPNITGSLLGTSSFSNNSTSASYSLTSSIALVALTSSYINTATNAISSSYAGTASISISSSFATTSSYNLNSISSSYSLTASFAANAGSSLTTGSTYPITSSWSNNAISSSYANVAATATSATSANSANTANSATSASYALTASFALNASGGGGSGTVTGSVNYIAKFTSGSSVGNSVIYETGSNIGIGTTVPNSKLNINSSGSLVSGSVVFSVEGTQGSLFSVDDNLSGSLMSVNDVSGLPILEVFSDDRLVVGTYNSNALVVTGSRVGIGTNVPIAKLQVSGNISGSSFTSSVSNGVGFLGTSSFSTTSSLSITSSFSITSSYALNALTASYALNASGGGGGSGTVTGSTNYISKFTSATSVGNSVIYETGSNIGIGTTVPNSKLNINSSGSLVSGSVVFSVEGTQGSLFSVDDNLSGSLMSVNDVSGLPILEVFSDDRLVVGTYNSNALVVTGSRVGIGTNNPIAKLQVNGNISGSSFTGSVFGTSSWSTNALTASYAAGGGTTLTTGSTYPITSSWATTSSNIIGGTSNYIPLWSTNTSLGNSVLYQNSSNIGIGTTSPSYKLDINGIIAVSNSPFADKTGNYNRIYNPSGDGCIYLGNVSDPGNYYDNTNHYFRNRGNTTTYVTINISGSVGIGTTSPASILHLQSSAATTLLRIDNSTNTNDAAILLTDSTNPTGEGLKITYDSSVGDTYFNNIYTLSTRAFNFQKGDFGSGTSLLTILNDGNVGIGTTSPVAKLQVNGNISGSSFTGSVFGTSSWATNALTASYNLNSVSSSYALTASFSLNGGGGGTTLTTGSTYPITSSWSNNATTASYALNASGGGGGISYITGSPVIGQYIVVSGSSTTQYTLTQSVSNPEHLLVSVNGVVQNYSSSYTVTGSTLNFYQPYSDGDEIDVRFLNGNTTLQTGSIANQTILYNFSSSQESTLTGLNLTGNKWGISVVEEWNSGSGDIYYPSCSLLMHFSGSNNSTTFIDNSPNNFTVTSNNGAKITSSISKFGSGSGFFDGTNDYLTLPSTITFTGDFTIETWVYWAGGSSFIQYAGIISNRTATGVFAPIYIQTTSGTLESGNWGISGYVGSALVITAGVWNHVALVRSGTTLRFYINGVQDVNTGSVSGTLTASNLTIGSSAIPQYWNGYIDELRITKGVARYTGSFATQSVQFPDILPQYETKYIGLVGGLNDTGSDYGVQKLDDTSLKIRKMSVSGTPVSGSPILSSSVDRVYVNVLNYDNVLISGSITNAVTSSYAVTSITSSYALSASYLIPTSNNTTKAIFGYGFTSVNVSMTNLVSNTGVVATDTTGIGTARYALAASGYGGDKAIFGYGYNGSISLSMTNLTSNTGVVSTDTTGVGTARYALAAAGYGGDKAIFGYGLTSINVSMTNLVSNIGIVATDTTGVGTARYGPTSARYGTDKAIFGYGTDNTNNFSLVNLVSNIGVVANDTTGVGTARRYLASAGYGGDKAIFGYGYTVGNVSMVNLISNIGIVANDVTGVGTARYGLASAVYGNDKAIFGYGYNGSSTLSMTNLVNNTGVVATDTTGVGTARWLLAAAGYSTS